jgi:hypothetical protein
MLIDSLLPNRVLLPPIENKQDVVITNIDQEQVSNSIENVKEVDQEQTMPIIESSSDESDCLLEKAEKDEMSIYEEESDDSCCLIEKATEEEIKKKLESKVTKEVC